MENENSLPPSSNNESLKMDPVRQNQEDEPVKLEAWYSMNKGLIFVGIYTVVLGGAVYFIAMRLPQIVAFLFSLGFFYMWSLQLRTFLTESKEKSPVFVLTDQGINLRPLEFQTVPWKDIAKIEIVKKGGLGGLLGQHYVAVTIKGNAKLAPAVARWMEGKGQPNEFFLTSHNMTVSMDAVEAFLTRYASDLVAS